MNNIFKSNVKVLKVSYENKESGDGDKLLNY
jgi:hypothetical protein